ncbi:MAG: hypothetical protein MZV63_02105 [Marinilabiliales bacterium]|nr:hypothetical protein [Marinilabiliales bacterium]
MSSIQALTLHGSTGLLWSGALDRADLIIGPVFSYHVEKISSWAAERNIPVVSPVGLRDRHILENKPTSTGSSRQKM